ncbi:formylglycine-generating enzyme family protein [Myxococcota bacterium]|nr:formylglycine-generating enzyme family protein [Myxococcota bacterium]
MWIWRGPSWRLSIALLSVVLAGNAAAQSGQAGSGDALEDLERELQERKAVAEKHAAQEREEARRAEEKRVAESRAAEVRASQAEAARQVAELRKGAFVEMVRIPAGEFWVGCNDAVDTECEGDEKPGRKVMLGAYTIDRTEVTVAAYGACVSSGGCSPPDTDSGYRCNWQAAGRDLHPVNCIDWDQASVFCRWNGKRLPTGQEWEKAARGTDGRKYPWGTEEDAAAGGLANLSGQEDGFFHTSPVGSYPKGKSPFGVFDMAGNVAEWTSDPDVGLGAFLRGGSWLHHLSRDARASNRNVGAPAARSPGSGFRCAQ